jgi:hypothetical protein
VRITIDPGSGGRTLGGSDHPPFTETLLDGVLSTIRTSTNDPKAATTRIAAAATALAAFAPADEIEGMIAGQCVALHHGAMECLRRAVLPDQHPDIASKLRRDAANLARTMTDMLEALDRRRGKSGKQLVRVEHIHIHPGAQAVVGNIEAGARPGGGHAQEMREEPHVSPARLAHDTTAGPSLPPLRGANAEWETVPRSGNEERPLPIPRRKIDGPENG